MARHLRVVGLLCGVVLLGGGPVHAETCADANRDGAVTDTDAVLILRAAAGLSSTAVSRTCDLDLDRSLTDTDGVLALRMAAGLPAPISCAAAQVEAITERSGVVLRLGAAPIPSNSQVRIAQTTVPCADGGFFLSEDFSDEFFDCSEDGVVTNGLLLFDVVSNTAIAATLQDLSLRDLATNEVTVANGTLTFDFASDPVIVEGDLANVSSVLGSFVDSYFNVQVSNDGFLLEGEIVTEVTSGLQVFAGVDYIDFIFLESGVTDLTIFFLDGSSEGFVSADGLCSACSFAGQCPGPLGCVPCDSACVGAPSRCSVDFAVIDCGDGNFVPPDLCSPCVTDANCSGSLECFACDRDCTGNVDRCASTIRFVDCGDGEF
jgi:hypothetical protein